MRFIYLLFALLSVTYATPFITVWHTTTDNETIEFPMIGIYDYSLDTNSNGIFEDEYNKTDTFSVVFTTAGDHIVKISPNPDNGDGKLQIKLGNSTQENASKLIDITDWSSYPWKSMDQAFKYASGLTSLSANNAPDLSQVTTMKAMFRQALKFNSDLSNWQTSNVTNMSNVFFQATAFNQDLSNWDTSKVTTMAGMFCQATAFNQDISNWETSKVTTLYRMFQNAENFGSSPEFVV